MGQMEAGSGFDRSARFNKFGVAEGVGFEPTEGTRPSTAFKAAAFVHSATPPPSHPPTPGPPRRTLFPWLAAPGISIKNAGYSIPQVTFYSHPASLTL